MFDVPLQELDVQLAQLDNYNEEPPRNNGNMNIVIV